MLKYWAAWPRGTRWRAGIAAVVLALAIVWVLFVPVPDWLAHHDVGSAKGPLLQTARDAARGRLLTLAAGLLATGALLYTARNFALSRRTFELTEQGQVTDRYTKAIEQLGSDKPGVRIGGIYALERVARDSARDHPTVMEVLTAFIRKPWPPTDVGGQEPVRSTQPDIQAALTVIGRRDAEHDILPINLRGADLTGAVLTGAIPLYESASLLEEELTGASLRRAVLGRVFVSLGACSYQGDVPARPGRSQGCGAPAQLQCPLARLARGRRNVGGTADKRRLSWPLLRRENRSPQPSRWCVAQLPPRARVRRGHGDPGPGPHRPPEPALVPRLPDPGAEPASRQAGTVDGRSRTPDRRQARELVRSA
jgi:hypothetical protein